MAAHQYDRKASLGGPADDSTDMPRLKRQAPRVEGEKVVRASSPSALFIEQHLRRARIDPQDAKLSAPIPSFKRAAVPDAQRPRALLQHFPRFAIEAGWR